MAILATITVIDRLSLFFLVVLFCIPSFSQDAPGEPAHCQGKTVLGKKQGPFTCFYKDGKLQANFNYKDNLKEGLASIYLPDGKKEMDLHYKDNILNGMSTHFDASGKITKEQNFRDGRMDGRYTEYYPNGKKKIETFYIHNVQNGAYTEWWENGQVKTQGHPNKQGVQTGEDSHYDQNGNLNPEDQ